MYLSVPGLGEPPTGGAREFDGVFEGGGAKGTAFVGALAFLEQHGMWFRRVAGTSAGAITAALIAAGYRSAELQRITFATDFNQFKDPPTAASFTDQEIQASPFYQLLSAALAGLPGGTLIPAAARTIAIRESIPRVPYLNSVFSLFAKGGLFAGDAFRRWINDQIKAKLRQSSAGVSDWPTFQQMYAITNIRLSVIASDITSRRMLVFNDHRTPAVPVADAVRMSMSIPIFYAPFRYQGCPVVDGGALSNYPMFLFSSNRDNVFLPNTPEDERRPKVGFLLDEDPRRTDAARVCTRPANAYEQLRSPLDQVLAVVNTMMESFDRQNTKNYEQNTVHIDVTPFETTQFDLTDGEKYTLADRGWQASANYFRTRGVPAPRPSPFAARATGPAIRARVPLTPLGPAGPGISLPPVDRGSLPALPAIPRIPVPAVGEMRRRLGV